MCLGNNKNGVRMLTFSEHTSMYLSNAKCILPIQQMRILQMQVSHCCQRRHQQGE